MTAYFFFRQRTIYSKKHYLCACQDRIILNKMDIWEILAVRLEKVLVDLVVEKTMDQFNGLVEKCRLLGWVGHIQDNRLPFDDIVTCMYEYAFGLYIFYIGEAESRYKKHAKGSVMKAFCCKMMGRPILDTMGEEYYKYYRTATAKINTSLYQAIVALLEAAVITQDQSLELCDKFLKETHVWYSLMPIAIGGDGKQDSFIHVIQHTDPTVINRYFTAKYKDVLLQTPCKGDFYRLFKAVAMNDSNILFTESFYDTPNKIL